MVNHPFSVKFSTGLGSCDFTLFKPPPWGSIVKQQHRQAASYIEPSRIAIVPTLSISPSQPSVANVLISSAAKCLFHSSLSSYFNNHKAATSLNCTVPKHLCFFVRCIGAILLRFVAVVLVSQPVTFGLYRSDS